MIGHSTSEYIFIRCAIAALRLVAPLSLLIVGVSWYTDSWIGHRWLGYYASLEAFFYLLVYLPRSYYLQKVSEFGRLAAWGPRVTPHIVTDSAS